MSIKKNKGFTLVELIVVLAILAIIASIAMPFVNGYLYDSKLNADKAVASDMQNAIDMWMHLDRTPDVDKVNYSYLGVTEKIGTMSEYQYYNTYAGTSQLPGTEFTDEADIRKAVLSAMKSVMGNKLIINSDWTIESPKAGTLLSYRYYYRLGLIKIKEYTEKEKTGDELESYYITLDRVGYSNVAGSSFDKFLDEDILSTGIEDKTVQLYGLDASKLNITEGLVSIWDLGTNTKTTCSIDKLGTSKVIGTGLYYVSGKIGDTVTDIKFLLAINGLEGKCYSFENYSFCSTEYIQKVKNAINENEDTKIDSSEIVDFLNAKDSAESIKMLESVGATESEVGFDTDRYVIDYSGVVKPPIEEEEVPDIPESLGWHIIGDVKYHTVTYGPRKGESVENVPHKIEKENGLKVYFYGDTVYAGEAEGHKDYWYSQIYDWETDVFEVKDATICLELDSTDRHVPSHTRSDSYPEFCVDIVAVDEMGNESVYATIKNNGEVYVTMMGKNTRTTGVVKLEDGKYKLKTSSSPAMHAAQAWLNVYFGKQTDKNVLPYAKLLEKGELKQDDGLVNFTVDTPTILTFTYQAWSKVWKNHDNDVVGKIEETMILYRDGQALLNPKPGKTYKLVLMPGTYQIGIVRSKNGNTDDSYYSESTAKISGIKETIPTYTMYSVTNSATMDDGYGGGYIGYGD